MGDLRHHQSPSIFAPLVDTMSKESEFYSKLCSFNLRRIGSVGLAGFWDCAEEEGRSFPSGKVFALDCEMVRTTKDPREVAKVTLLNFSGDSCFESLIKPSCKVLDYKTKHSGITKEMLKGVKTTRSDARRSLHSLISADDILIGHSIDHDLKCLGLSHNKVLYKNIFLKAQRIFLGC